MGGRLIWVIAKLWFDVERRYKTILRQLNETLPWLWFDVERRYKTIGTLSCFGREQLWFDVERRYKTMYLQKY